MQPRIPPISLAACILAASHAGSVAAAGGTEGLGVGAIRIAADGDVVATLAAAHRNPDGCAEADKVVLERADPQQARLYAILVLAKSARESASFWVSGCHERDGTTYPRARTVTWRP